MKKSDYIERNMATMLATLGDQEMTRPQLAEAAGMAAGRASQTLAHLRAGGQIHISQWHMQSVYVPIFKAGDGADAVKPSKAAQDHACLCKDVLHLLRDGIKTKEELLAGIHYTTPRLLQLALQSLHDRRAIHIDRYAGATWSMPIYAGGFGIDARPGRAANTSPASIPPPDPITAALFAR